MLNLDKYFNNKFSSFESQSFHNKAHLFMLSGDVGKVNVTRLSGTTKSLVESGTISVDLLIDSITYDMAEFQKLEENIGDNFSHHFYGKSPIVLNVSGKLIDTTHNMGKLELTELYQDVFRLNRVAKLGVAPYLYFTGSMMHGAMLELNLSEDAETQDVITVSFLFLILDSVLTNANNPNCTISTNYFAGNLDIEAYNASTSYISKIEQSIDEDIQYKSNE